MTSTPSVRAQGTHHQDRHGRLLGERQPTPAVRLTLHERDDGAVLVRHRVNAHAGSGADLVAHIAHAGGVVSEVRWDHWHTEHRPVWMPQVEDWIRAQIADDSSDRS